MEAVGASVETLMEASTASVVMAPLWTPVACNAMVRIIISIVEPLSNGHAGTSFSVHYREVSSLRRSEMYRKMIYGAPNLVLYLECPLTEVPRIVLAIP